VFGTPSPASLLINAQSSKVITLQSLSAHFPPPKLSSFRAPPTHDAVVGVPVGVLPARGGEDGPEQTREVVGVETGQPIVGAGELGGAIEADPGPPRAPSEGQRGSAPQVSELHRPVGDECAHLRPGHRVRHHRGVDQRGMRDPSERRVLTTAR